MLKTQIEQLNHLRLNLHDQINVQLAKVTAEGKKLLSQLGVDTSDTDITWAKLFSQLREQNPSLKDLWFKLDTATYDVRKKLSWDAHMMSAYAKLKAEEALSNDIKPRIELYKGNMETRLKDLVSKAEAVKSKLLH